MPAPSAPAPRRPLLSHSQLSLLRAAFDHVRRTRKIPSNAEIAAALGVSGHYVTIVLTTLELKGMLHRPSRGVWAFTKAGLWVARPRRGAGRRTPPTAPSTP